MNRRALLGCVMGCWWAALPAACQPAEEPDEPLLAVGKISLPPPAAAPAVVAPLEPVNAADPAPDTGASPIAGASVDARVLIITASGSNSAFGAIENTLEYLGTPFDVLDAATGPALTADALASGTHGKYDAVFLDVGDLGGGFTQAEWTTLTTYEVQFGVRRVSLYTSPKAGYGFTNDDQGVDPSTSPISATCTAAGAQVFVGTNCANPVLINQGYAYPATALDDATTPLLVDANGHIYAAIRQYPDGREALALTFGQAPTYVSYLELAYGLVDWATRGLFVGERHVYAMPQIDDLFLASAIYTGGTYRITDADLQQFADWQSGVQARPLTAGFRVAWAANGYGSSMHPGDPLTAEAAALGSTFAWINHSWDHAVLDTLGYAQALPEFTQNDQYLRGLGLLPYASVNAVTPNISGLASADAMRAIHDAGIQQIVSDTSEPGEDNPTPNAGIWNALQPSVLEIPRKATDLYFNVSQPAEWIAEYQALRGTAGIDYPTVKGIVSDDLFHYLLNGSNDPWMFHQADTRDYDGAGHSLLGDLLDAAFAKYAAVMTFPVVSPTMDDLAARVRNRMALDRAGVVATISGGVLTVSVAHGATIPVTGLCTPDAERYGGQIVSYLSLSDGQSATYSLDGCPGGAPALDGGGDPGGAGASPGGPVMSGSAANHVDMRSPVTASGCACALVGGAREVNATFVWLVGGALLARRRRRA